MRFWVLFIVFHITVVGVAQEQLTDLKNNSNLSAHSLQQSRFPETTFLIDTLELPFLDDFSKVRLHRYCNSENLIFLDSVIARYRIDGEPFDTINVTFDTTFSYYYSSFTQRFDTVPNTELSIQVYDPSQDTLVASISGIWPVYNYTYKDGILIESLTDTLIPDSVFVNELIPIYIAYDSLSLWINNDVYINNTYSIDPPTVGVATFDGLDSLGHAYNIGQENSYGVADYLTSKPINLENKSGVVLSFYYQAQGLGNSPEEEDSLVLEFYAPDSSRWQHVWSTPGEEQKDFQYVTILIEEDMYLQKGFKFRFSNYATLSGSLDHWHLDYVYLNSNRDASDISVSDLGFKTIEPFMTEIYTFMPWHQYLLDPATYTKEQFDFTLVNKSTLDLQGQNVYTVYDAEDNSVIFSSTPTITNFINFPGGTDKSLFFPVNSNPYDFVFPADNSREKHFRTVMSTASTTIQSTELNFCNDTLILDQIFSSYYAYDDGSPERAYSLIGAGAKLAYKFDLEEADTLTGLLIHLPEMFNLVDNSIRVVVWQGGAVPGDTLYRGPLFDVNYVDNETPIGFTRFDLDRLLILPEGEFYVGFEQNFSDEVFVGFDKNYNTQSKIFYNIDGQWLNTSFDGSLMIRPDFGDAEIEQIYSLGMKENYGEEFQIYPNPAKNEVNIVNANNHHFLMKILDISGREVYQQKLNGNTRIDLTEYAGGVYTISMLNTENNHLTTERLIISK